MSLIDEKACWFDAIVSVIQRAVFLEDVVVDEMYAKEKSFVCVSWRFSGHVINDQ